MEKREIRFSNGYGGMMVKFCDEHIVIAYRDWEDKKEATLIPYEFISVLKFSSWSGLQITTKDNWGTAVYIQEKKQIQCVVNSVLGKINKPTQKKREQIKLTDGDIAFIKVATKVKRNEPVTEQEKEILGEYVGEQYDNTKKGKFQNRIVWVLFIVVIAAVIFMIVGIFDSDSDKDKGYWGNDGYYHPSDEEMDDVWNDVNDWMDKNW